MDSSAPVNPYQQARQPFAGRKAPHARLHQVLSDVNQASAALYYGRQHIGKTALLRHIEASFDDNHIGVYIPLKDTPITDETDWLLTLSQAATAEIVGRDFTYSRLSDMQPPGDDPRGWFVNTFLREILIVIRAHRRMVFLLDDVDGLLDAMAAKRLPADSLMFLAAVLKQYHQIGLALTLDESREVDIPRLNPLAHPDAALRLMNLDLAACAELLRDPVTHDYRVADEAVAAAFQATGGVPVLAQMFGDGLFQHWERGRAEGLMTLDDVKAITPSVYRAAGTIFRRMWGELSRNEQLTLTAMSSLIYDDPLRTLDAAAIEGWLVRTDYPVDVTAINAALRSLTYRELVATPARGVTIKIGLMQNWLLENARLDGLVESTAPPSSVRTRRFLLIVAAALLILIGIILLTQLSNLPEPRPDIEAAPTVTLVGQPE
jgi:hypothetical protein